MLNKIKNLFAQKSNDIFIGIIDEDGVALAAAREDDNAEVNGDAFVNPEDGIDEDGDEG